jgi:hypothetical protein
MKITKCPRCGNIEHFMIEKSPYGNTTCNSCGHSQSHEWFIFGEELEITVMTFKPSSKYYDTIVIRLSDIMNKIEEYELCWYLVVEQIRRFRNRCGTDLEYLIGYSDDSVKNYTKNDIYPIILKD